MRPAALAALTALLFATAAAAHPSRGIAAAPDGRVYFSDLVRIWTIAPDGRVTLVRHAGGRHMHEIFLDPGGTLYGEESDYSPATRAYRAAIWRLRPGGGSAYAYGPTARPAPGMGVFRDARGCTFQADETRARALVLYRLCPGQRPEHIAGARSPPRDLLSNIGGAAFGADGSFYFRRGSSVHRLTPRGALTTAASGFSPENFGIAVDSAGALLVAEPARRRVVKLGGNGRRTIAATSSPPWSPTGVAVSRGSLYLLEASDHAPGRQTRVRVRKLSPGAPPRVLAVTAI